MKKMHRPTTSYDDGPLDGIGSLFPWLSLFLDAFSLLLFWTTWRRVLLTSLFCTFGARSQDPPSAEAREAVRLVSRSISSTACLEGKRNVWIRKYTQFFLDRRHLTGTTSPIWKFFLVTEWQFSNIPSFSLLGRLFWIVSEVTRSPAIPCLCASSCGGVKLS